MLELPFYAKLRILLHLDIDQIIVCRRISTGFAEAVEYDDLWDAIISRDAFVSDVEFSRAFEDHAEKRADDPRSTRTFDFSECDNKSGSKKKEGRQDGITKQRKHIVLITRQRIPFRPSKRLLDQHANYLMEKEVELMSSALISQGKPVLPQLWFCPGRARYAVAILARYMPHLAFAVCQREVSAASDKKRRLKKKEQDAKKEQGRDNVDAADDDDDGIEEDKRNDELERYSVLFDVDGDGQEEEEEEEEVVTPDRLKLLQLARTQRSKRSQLKEALKLFQVEFNRAKLAFDSLSTRLRVSKNKKSSRAPAVGDGEHNTLSLLQTHTFWHHAPNATPQQLAKFDPLTRDLFTTTLFGSSALGKITKNNETNDDDDDDNDDEQRRQSTPITTVVTLFDPRPPPTPSAYFMEPCCQQPFKTLLVDAAATSLTVLFRRAADSDASVTLGFALIFPFLIVGFVLGTVTTCVLNRVTLFLLLRTSPILLTGAAFFGENFLVDLEALLMHGGVDSVFYFWRGDHEQQQQQDESSSSSTKPFFFVRMLTSAFSFF